MVTAAQAQKPLDPPLCERSVGLQAVILELASEDHCGNFPENVLRFLTTLDATNKGITSLKAGDFHDFDSLTSLDLTGNPLRRLRGNVFRGLINLNDELNLQETELSAISGNVFNGLGKVRSLNLWGNRLKTLPAGAFRPLGELRVLNLGSNGMTSFHVDAFDGLGKLRELNMHNNLLETLPGNSWLNPLGLPVGSGTNRGRLQKLRLSNNRLRELPDFPFAPVQQTMRQLLLDGNHLTYLPRGIFEDMNLNPERGNKIDVVDKNGNLVLSIRDGGDIPHHRLIVEETILPGALRLDGDNQGDNDPWIPGEGRTAANPNHGNYDSAIRDETFTLPMYMWIDADPGTLNQGDGDRYWYDDSGVRMPHAAPFDLNINWTLTRNFASKANIFTGRITGLDAGDFIKVVLTHETPDRTGSDITFKTKDTAISIRWDIHARQQYKDDDDNYKVLMNRKDDAGRTACGFDPCYDGFGFAATWVYHHSDDGLNVKYPRMNVNVGGDSSEESGGHLYPVFLSAPANSDGYVAGEDVEVAVRYTTGPLARFAPITVKLRIGDVDRTANWLPTNVVGYPRVADRDALRFRYRVQEADRGIIRIVSVSGNSSIASDYRSPGIFRNGKTFIPGRSGPAAGGPDGDQKVQVKTYVSFESDVVSGKEGEKVHLNLRVTPAPTSDLVVNYHARRPGGGGAHWGDYDTEGSGEDDGSLTIGSGETTGRITVRLVDRLRNNHDNREPERAREYFYMDIEDGEGYEPGLRDRMTIVIKEGVCDRTPEVQEALMAATGRRDCGDVTTEDLAVIGELDMRDRGIGSLRRSDFLGLDHVSVLDLRNNRLSALPEGVFGEISDTLKVLRLQDNRWQRDLPDGMFTGLPNVQAIFMSDDPNSDASIRLPLRIEYVGEEPDFPLAAGTRVELKAVLREGAPYAFSARFQSTGTNTGYQLDTERSFARGDVESDTFTWTAAEKTNQIVISVTDLSAPPEDCPVKDGGGRCFSGVNVVSAEQVTLGGVRLRVRVFLENALE